jgi:hypothetical protein
MGDVDLKNALLAGDPEAVDETATIPTHAGDVVVRPLSRAEVLALKAERAAGMTLAEFEAHMVSSALVSPEMAAAEVQRWQAADKAGGALEDVSRKIEEISGLRAGADKSGVSAPSK